MIVSIDSFWAIVLSCYLAMMYSIFFLGFDNFFRRLSGHFVIPSMLCNLERKFLFLLGINDIRILCY